MSRRLSTLDRWPRLGDQVIREDCFSERLLVIEVGDNYFKIEENTDLSITTICSDIADTHYYKYVYRKDNGPLFTEPDEPNIIRRTWKKFLEKMAR